MSASQEDRREMALADRYEGYAVKFAIECDAEPTDENLAAHLGQCVRPARPEEYPAIRAQVARYRRGNMPGTASCERRQAGTS